MTAPAFLALTGYRATGKTSVGRILADLVGYQFVDTDDRVTQLAGQGIAELFATRGEAAFRDLESQVLSEATSEQHVIVALGGGAVLRPANRDLLKSAGPVVWLKASTETIRDRLQQDKLTDEQRPALSGANVVDEVEEVLSQRLPIYLAVADLEIDTEDHEPEAIATIIANAYFDRKPA